MSVSRLLLLWPALLTTAPGQEKAAERRQSRQKKARLRMQGFLILCFSASRQEMAAAWRLSKQKKARLRIQGLLLFCFSASRLLLLWSSLLAPTPGQKTAAKRRLSREKKSRLGIQGFLLLCFSASRLPLRWSALLATMPGQKKPRHSARVDKEGPLRDSDLPAFLLPRFSSSASLVLASSTNSWTNEDRGTAPV